MNKKPYIYKNKNTREKFYLHKKESKGGVHYFFSRSPVNAIPLPEGYRVKIREYSKYPVIIKNE